VKRVLLVGAGHAHAVLLAGLAEQPLYGASLMLVSPRARQVYSGMLPGVIAGHYAREEAEFDVAELARRASCEFVEGEAARFDPFLRKMQLSDGRALEFDLASLNVGSRIEAPAHTVPVKPFDAFLDRLQRAARIAIAGGGAAGAELAMALRQRGAEVTLYSHESPFREGVERRVVRALRRRGIDFRPGMRVDAVEQGPLVVTGAAHQQFDLVLWATGAQAQPWLRASGLAVDAGGFVKVDAMLRSESHPQVFALGDCAAAGEAKSGVHAVRQGRALERNLRRLVSNEPFIPYQRNARALMLLSCGARYAIAARGAWSAEGRWAWWWKDRIDRRWLRRLSGK
jgi:NADH dehydrogenase FAD-containing subunit